jgi:hypothetical protein
MRCGAAVEGEENQLSTSHCTLGILLGGMMIARINSMMN